MEISAVFPSIIAFSVTHKWCKENLLSKNYWLRSILLVVSFVVNTGFVFSSSVQVVPATGKTDPYTVSSPEGTINSYYQAFRNLLTDGKPKASSVYVEGLLLLDVIQQPKDQAGFVSEEIDSVTQFGLAAQHGTVGLLAHNYAAGARFSEINIGDRIHIAYDDGKTEGFIVKSIEIYQALSPKDPHTTFVDLSTQRKLSAEELFHNVYGGKHHLTLQTCITQGTENSWGRMFIIADPSSDDSTIN